MKVLEQVRASGSAPPLCIAPDQRDAWIGYAANYRALARTPNLPVLDANRFAKFYYADSDQEYWNLKNENDFGPLFSPHQMFWAEHSLPQVIRSRVKGSTFSSLDAAQGALVIGVPIAQVAARDVPEGTAHVLVIDPCFDYGFNKGIVGPFGPWIYPVDVRGRIVDRPWLNTFADPEHYEYMTAVLAGLNPILLAIGANNRGERLDWMVG